LNDRVLFLAIIKLFLKFFISFKNLILRIIIEKERKMS